MQRLSDRIKQHVPVWIKKKEMWEQPLCMYKIFNPKRKCVSSIAQHLIKDPEYTDDNFWITWQAKSSFPLHVLELVYIKTQNPILCKQKELVFTLGINSGEKVLLANHITNWMYCSSYHIYPYLAVCFGSPFSCYPTFHTLMSASQKGFQYA